MIKLTQKKVNLHAAHKRLWNFVAETGKGKDAWPEWGTFVELLRGCSYYNYCFACLAVRRDLKNYKVENDCKGCPITRNPVRDAANCCNGFWERFCYAKDPEVIKVTAIAIRDLPWRGRKIFSIEELKR